MNWFQRLFKKKRHFTKTVTCPICEKVVPQKGNMKTCGSKECKALWNRGKYALKHSPPDAVVESTSATAPLPGQIKLDDVLPEMTERSYPVQSSTANGNMQGKLTTGE